MESDIRADSTSRFFPVRGMTASDLRRDTMMENAIDTDKHAVIPGSYQKVDAITARGKRLAAWVSKDLGDTAWDRFLQESPQGQFQQSAMWARSKAAQGWNPVRVMITQDGEIVGGFQLLWQAAWHGRIGYVSKGPVIVRDHPAVAEYAIQLLREMARKEGLQALVVQPPDRCGEMVKNLESNGFLRNFLVRVNSATWMIDLRDGFEAAEKRMTNTTRNQVRRAMKGGLTIREGGRQDLATFFELMLASCRHQGVRPNPPDLEQLLAMWDALSPSGAIRLYFAEDQEKPLSGHLDILFGKTVAMWKMGSVPDDQKRAPNDFIFHQGLRWASDNHYENCDFVSFDREMAMSILRRDSLSRNQVRSRYLFLTRFGGRPCLLPAAQVYFPNWLLRSIYRICFRGRMRKMELEASAIQQVSA